MSREYIAATLKRLREQSDLTIYQVGKALGKSGKTISAWENNHGQPDAEILMKLCDLYNVDDILAEFKENKSSEDKISINDKERKLILAYREHKSMRSAIDKMLDIDVAENKTITEDIIDELKQDARKNNIYIK